MMIAIVILGLGLIMVATIFPVAWDRARRLSESTAERSISAGAYATIKDLIQPTGVAFAPDYSEDRLFPGSFAGDLVYDPVAARRLAEGKEHPVDWSILAYSDTRVHALHLQNRRVEDDKFVHEDPWDLEWMEDFADSNYVMRSGDQPAIGREVAPGFYFYPQIAFESRVHPPMAPEPNPTAPDSTSQKDLWNKQLSTRKFSWAILHRLQRIAGPARPTPSDTYDPAQLVAEAIAAMGSARTLDVYRVTLRRDNATKRYARQKPDPNALPDPYNLANDAVVPQARDADEDVAFPVAWRVQVQFPFNLNAKPNLTGVPTEIQVPPKGITGQDATMLTQMFPTGTRFVDEINGQVYRVAKRRVTIDGSGNQLAFLTLDREVLFEDVEDKALEEFARPRLLHRRESLRTVWVYPPPVDRSAGGPETVFEGKSPVVNIDVRTISLSPSG